MAHTFLNAKLISALVDGFSVAIYRRGFSSVSQGVAASVLRGGNRSGIVKQVEERAIIKEGSETSWVPDPVTGYYRPENLAADIDVVELRQSLLNHKIRQH